MSRNKHKIQKGLLYPTAALIVSLPICMAEQAIASSSFFRTDSQQFQSQTAIATQTQSLPKSYRDLLSRTFAVPSLEDLNTLNSTLQNYESQLKTLKISKVKDPLNESAYTVAISNLERVISEFKAKIAVIKTSLSNLKEAKDYLAKALETYSTASTALNSATSTHTSASDALALASATKTSQETITANAKATLDSAQEAHNSATSAKNSADAALTQQKEVTAQSLDNLTAKQNAVNSKAAVLSQAQATLNQAQHNYDTLLIPDPTWTPPTHLVQHTRLVPQTTYTVIGKLKAEVFNRQGYNNAPPLPTQSEQPNYTTEVSNINFQWGSGQVLNSGYSEDVIVRFTGIISAPTTGTYQFYAPADDGVQLYIDGNRIINDWYDKGGGGSVSQSVYLEAGTQHTFTLYYYENGGGANVWLYYYTPSTGYQIVPSTWLGSSAEEVTTYVEEIYYTEEVILTTETIDIEIPEGHTKTYTLPEGSVIVSSQLRYESYANPTCGADISPALQGTTITLSASNAIFGDPCGGQYKHITGTITYETPPTAPLIHDPALLPAVQDAQQNLEASQQAYDSAASNLQTAQSQYNVEVEKQSSLQVTFNEASLNAHNTAVDLSSAQVTHTEESNKLITATSNEDQAKIALDSAKLSLDKAQLDFNTATTNKTLAEQSVISSEDSASTSLSSTIEASTKIDAPLQEATDILNKEPAPEPEPEPEPEGSPEIPPVIEDLMEIDLEKVDPTELTPEQATQLVEAALETFETATEGSPEYEQALDALYVAAQQDDIVLDESIAAIPGVGQAAQAVVAVFNIVGNVGADISPKARKKAQEVVVTTLVVGQIAQTAAIAQAASGGSFRRRS